MTTDECPFSITTLFDSQEKTAHEQLYHEAILKIIRKIFPQNLLSSAVNHKERAKIFHSHLPFFTHILPAKAPSNLSFFVVSRYRSNAFKFFFEMVSTWLIPGQRLNVLAIYAADFRVLEFGQATYTLCEVMIRVEKPEELEQIRKNLEIISIEVRLGMESSYYALRILETKGLNADAKTALLQEYIIAIMKRKPQYFDYDLLTEMQHFLIICRDEFKMQRSCLQLTRIVTLHYLFRQWIKKAYLEFSEKRYLFLKIFKINQDKPVLGIVIAVNFFKDKEVLEKKHLLTAIQNYIPSVQALPSSFFSNRREHDHCCTIYIEVEKSEGDPFSFEEIALLKRNLANDLKDRVSHLMNPVFMPRNEEEIMRNILSLSSEIKFMRDIPQVCINFDEQSHSSLFFNIIVARVMIPGTLSVQEMFKTITPPLEYIHDRTKTVGYLRKKYIKEATVFRLKISKDQFLREDQSIDLYKARQQISLELLKVLGDFRDFNGGMISKQNEAFEILKASIQEEIKCNELLLENFFYSLTPVVMRTVIATGIIKELFFLILQMISQPEKVASDFEIMTQLEIAHAYIIVKSDNKNLKNEILKSLSKLHLNSCEFAHAFLQIYDHTYAALVYFSKDPAQQQQFIDTIVMDTKPALLSLPHTN